MTIRDWFIDRITYCYNKEQEEAKIGNYIKAFAWAERTMEARAIFQRFENKKFFDKEFE